MEYTEGKLHTLKKEQLIQIILDLQEDNDRMRRLGQNFFND